MPNNFDGMSEEEKKQTQEILEEMKEDNIQDIGQQSDEESEESEDKTEDKSDENSDKKTAEEESTEETVEEESAEEDEEIEKNRPQRKFQTVPLPKYMKLKDEVSNLKEELEKISKSNKSEDRKDAEIDDLVGSMSSELSEELGLDKSKLEGIFGGFANAIISKTKIPDEFTTVIKQAQEREAWAREEELFNKEIEALQKDYPDEKIDKKTLHDMAFSEDYAKKSLFEIHFRHIKPNQKEEEVIKGRKTIESAKGGTEKSKKIVDLNRELSAEEILELSDEEFDELSITRESGQSSRSLYDDKGNRVK